MKSPPKEKRGCYSALKTAELLAAYRLLPVSQAAPLEKINQAHAANWEKEAARLFQEFWRSGDQKHLCAFSIHVVAMQAYKTRVT